MQFKGLKSKNEQSISIDNIKDQLNHTEDLKKRDIQVHDVTYTIYYIFSLVDQEKLESKVIKPLTKIKSEDIVNELYSKEITAVADEEKAIDGLLTGHCLLLQKNDSQKYYLLDVASSIGRAVSEPLTEKTMQGAHEGFVERIDENIHMVRKQTVIPGFTVKKYEIGTEAATSVGLLYIDSLVDTAVLKKVEERLNSIDLDFIFSAGDIQDYIEEETLSPFPQLLFTELTERAATNLKSGKIAILIDGSSKAIILPATFTLFFQTPDDHVSRWELGTFFRILRLISYVNALILPAIYIAVVSFHYEVIPTELVYSFQSSLSYVPFRPIIELMAMQFTFELLREASIRLPPSIASTFGIVGAIVVGTAMVEAGFVSFGGLVIVALTAVSSFVQPNIEMSSSIRVLGFPLMIFAGVFGFVGIVLGLLITLIHLSRLTSFGLPYFSPFAPLKIQDFSEMVIRIPVWMKKSRLKNSKRLQKDKLKREWKLNESDDPY